MHRKSFIFGFFFINYEGFVQEVYRGVCSTVFSSIRVKNRRFGTSLITWIGAEFFVVCCHYVQETTVANEYHIPYVRTGECFGAMN
jgi:hypothetical protein